ncbi:MAG: hypothetical protein ACREOE_04565 [Gemmatimonadales bacterium]
MRRNIALVLGALLVAVPLSAQRYGGPGGLREVRRGDDGGNGLWGSFTLGWGREGFRFDSMNTYESDFSAPTYTFKLGGTPSRFFKLGGEISAWNSNEAESRQTLSSYLFIAQWYPGGRPFYLKGGIGLVSNHQSGSDPVNGTYVYRDNGYGGVIGIGADIPVGRRLALSPELNVYGQRYDNAGTSNDYRERVITFGVGITFK